MDFSSKPIEHMARSTDKLRVGGRDSASRFSGHMEEILIEKHADLVVTTAATYDLETNAFEIV